MVYKQGASACKIYETIAGVVKQLQKDNKTLKRKFEEAEKIKAEELPKHREQIKRLEEKHKRKLTSLSKELAKKAREVTLAGQSQNNHIEDLKKQLRRSSRNEMPQPKNLFRPSESLTRSRKNGLRS